MTRECGDWKNCTTLFANCLGVFQGGGCRAIAYAGAYEEAVKRGIYFSEVAGTSAGAIFAALIAAGATPEFLKKVVYSDELKKIPVTVTENRKANKAAVFGAKTILAGIKIAGLFSKKIRRSEWLKHPAICNIRHTVRALQHQYGIFDSDHIGSTVNGWLKELTGKDEVRFSDLKLKLYVFASDINSKRCQMWSAQSTPDAPVAAVVAASCSIPFYFSPVRMKSPEDVATIYVDGGILSNRPDFIAKDKPNYFQTLSFKLEPEAADSKGLSSYVTALIDTVIYGADELQHKSTGIDEETFGITKVNEVGISVGNISATDFSSLTQDKIKELLDAGRKGMRKFIEHTDRELSKDKFREYAVTPRRILQDPEQMYNQVAFWSYESYDTILVSDNKFDWVWSMFPTIVSWLTRCISVIVYYDEGLDASSDETQNAKKRLLESLGCQLHPVKSEKLIKGFIFRSKEGADYKCVLFEGDSSDPESSFRAKIYNDPVDSQFIHLLMKLLGIDTKPSPAISIGMKKLDEKIVFDRLRTIPPYRDASFEFKNVALSDLRFLKSNVRSLKYKELRHIKQLYDQENIPLYQLTKLIFNDGKESIMTPVIVECTPEDGYIVIKGNARSLKLYRENPSVKTIPAVVISHVDPPLSVKDVYKIDELTLSEQKNRGAVTQHVKLFRSVDQALRPNSTYLR